MDVSWQLQLDARAPDSPWAMLSSRMGGDARVLGAFALLYAALVALALLPWEPVAELIIVWPAAGLLLLVLWFADRRLWPLILLLQVVLEILCGWLVRGLSGQLLAMVVAHALAGLLGAAIVQQVLGGSQGLRVVALLRFACAAVAGAAAGMLVQVIAALVAGGVADLGRLALLWWLAGLLGALTTLPTVLSWLVSYRFAGTFPPLSRAQRVELSVVLVVQLVVVVVVFAGDNRGGALSHLRFPVLVVLGLMYAAVRLPPRWNTALLGTTGLLTLWLVARGGNPFGIEEPLTRVLWIQLSVLVFSLAMVWLSVYIAQSRLAMQELAATQARYSSFIETCSEAVWRIELDPPMPLELSQPAQLDWLRRCGRVVERSTSFVRIAGEAEVNTGWAPDLPWVQVFETNLAQLRQGNFRADDLRFSAIFAGRVHTYLTAFHGVIEGGRLERIWGVARDVTELFDLNARLLREQELLRSYAQRIVVAEEGARRSTAVELHNGIGQELVAMGMLLTALGNQLSPEQRAPLDEFRGRLHRVQQRTRDMISDLSPPGLYDLGLMPALQWLVVYLRGHDQLQVELDGKIEEGEVSTDLRVLVFKLVRELLRNVVKHAAIGAAVVSISGDSSRLLVEVRDAGRGFAWDPDSLLNPRRGFGLWSIANRVAEAGGQLRVESAPGQGARFTLTIPLRR